MKKLLFLLLTIIPILSVQITTAQWVQVSNGMGNKIVYSLVFSGNYIFAGTNNFGVYFSTDNGASWTQTSLNNLTVYSLAVNGNTVYAGTGNQTPNGVYISTNSGTSWTQTSLNNQTILSLAVSGNHIFAGIGNPGTGVYLSTDNGISWIQTLNFLNRGVYSLAVNGNNVFAGAFYDGVYLSVDNGTSWVHTSLIHRIVYSLAVNENNVFAGTDGDGVYLSVNNGTGWTLTSLGYQYVLSLAVNGNNIFAGTENGIFVSNDNGVNWTQRNEGLGGMIVYGCCILNNYIFASTYGNSVYRRPLNELVGIKSISTEVPNKFSLFQNYPNPFNPSTKIRFALPKSSFAKLVIYDALGRELETIVNEQLNAGTYEADWNANNFASGVYFYELTAGDYSQIKKMVLIK